MSCPGIHCPGCSGGQSLGVLGAAVIGLAAADRAVPWIAGRIWWIGGTLAACYALSVAAGMWLAARNDRRSRQWGRAHGIYSRADYIAPARAAAVRPAPARPGITPAQVTIKRLGWPAGQQAAIMRPAIPGTAGDITEGADHVQDRRPPLPEQRRAQQGR